MSRKLIDELEKKERKAKLLDDINSTIKESIPLEEIGIRLTDKEQMFNQLDPMPLDRRSLSRDFEEYCLEQLENIPLAKRIRIRIYLDEVCSEDIEKIKSAFENHFKKKAKAQITANRKESRKWRMNLLVGLLCMAACLVTAHVLGLPKFADIPLNNAISESLGILGWVAIWEPAEYFLFGWRSNTNILQQYMRLHLAQVEVTVPIQSQVQEEQK